MRVDEYNRSWQVEDIKSLDQALASRDERGGAQFFLSHDNMEYPFLAVRICSNVADVCFFPKEGHPGFRCLGGEGLPEGGSTTFVFQGCDPVSGEETRNEFVVPLETAHLIAKEFFHKKQMSQAVSWFEL